MTETKRPTTPEQHQIQTATLPKNMADAKQIVLITGANIGLGFALASLLIEDSAKHVLVCSRSIEKGTKAIEDLQALNKPGSVELLELDVTNIASVNAAAAKVQAKYGRVDGLVNNAGISGLWLPKDVPIDEKMEITFRTNSIGPQIVFEAFAPLLEKSQGTPRIINVTSVMGSLTLRLDPSVSHYQMNEVHYRASKAAVNMISACQACEYGPKGWKFFLYCPGFTATNVSPFNVAENGAHSAEVGAKPMVAMLNGERDSEHGGFLHLDGQHPW